ncbi:MAG: hypothetical protein ACK5IQ_08165 [Bacteroidales bacterium]
MTGNVDTTILQSYDVGCLWLQAIINSAHGNAMGKDTPPPRLRHPSSTWRGFRNSPPCGGGVPEGGGGGCFGL